MRHGIGPSGTRVRVVPGMVQVDRVFGVDFECYDRRRARDLALAHKVRPPQLAALIFRLLSLLNQAVNVSFCLAGRALAIILDAANILVAQVNGPFPPPRRERLDHHELYTAMVH
jgi:hypothetical protein